MVAKSLDLLMTPTSTDLDFHHDMQSNWFINWRQMTFESLINFARFTSSYAQFKHQLRVRHWRSDRNSHFDCSRSFFSTSITSTS